MEDLLTASNTRSISEEVHEAQLTPAGLPSRSKPQTDVDLLSPSDLLEVLRSQPNLEALTRCLKWLRDGRKSATFNIRIPSPQAARIINVLVIDITPNYWPFFNGQDSFAYEKQRSLLLSCLASLAGIGAIVARIRALVTLANDKNDQKPGKSKISHSLELVKDLLHVLEALLRTDQLADAVWRDSTQKDIKQLQQTLLWKEFVSLLAGGKLLSIVAEANSILNDHKSSIEEQSWIGDGKIYARWLGRNINCMISEKGSCAENKIKPTAELFSKAFALGYNDQVVESVFSSTINGDDSCITQHVLLLHSLPNHEQKRVLFAILRIIFQRNSSVEDKPKSIRGTAALLDELSSNSAALQSALADSLMGDTNGGVGFEIDARRAIIAAIKENYELLKHTFEKVSQHFGDKLYIQHTPVLHQEVNTQNLLLLFGRLNRLRPDFGPQFSRSSIYINSISNRLAASSLRARFLGMVVGTTISELVDPEHKRMNFSADDMSSQDGTWYRKLVTVDDPIGSISDLKSTIPISAQLKARDLRGSLQQKPASKSASTSKIASIEELDSGSESEEDDLPTYQKPDSDEEDSDEDPTLIQRNKPTAPVYIRDLIAGLRDTENHDRHFLALSNAADLIRRKSRFGTEVLDHTEELATQLVGLSDKYNMEKFQEMRISGMIAILIAQPLEMGQWFCKTYFNGDYSVGQRVSVLTTLGLGARELAGYKKEDSALTGAYAVGEKSFPSKKLPDKYHKIYAADTAPINAVSQYLESTMMKPMAIEAVDKLIGPNALKVRMFSSRMEVEKKRRKAIPNELAKVVADGFFFPLAGRWRIQLQTYGDQTVFSSPFLLSHFLKTLALILNASGSSTLSLPALTTEFWSLLLSLRSAAHNATPVLEALLFSLLTLLEINSNDGRALAEDHPKELLETQAWVEQIFEKLGAGSKEDERIRMLAAGVLVKTREVVDKYQRLLMGDLVNYM